MIVDSDDEIDLESTRGGKISLGIDLGIDLGDPKITMLDFTVGPEASVRQFNIQKLHFSDPYSENGLLLRGCGQLAMLTHISTGVTGVSITPVLEFLLQECRVDGGLKPHLAEQGQGFGIGIALNGKAEVGFTSLLGLGSKGDIGIKSEIRGELTGELMLKQILADKENVAQGGFQIEGEMSVKPNIDLILSPDTSGNAAIDLGSLKEIRRTESRYIFDSDSGAFKRLEIELVGESLTDPNLAAFGTKQIFRKVISIPASEVLRLIEPDMGRLHISDYWVEDDVRYLLGHVRFGSIETYGEVAIPQLDISDIDINFKILGVGIEDINYEYSFKKLYGRDELVDGRWYAVEKYLPPNKYTIKSYESPKSILDLINSPFVKLDASISGRLQAVSAPLLRDLGGAIDSTAAFGGQILSNFHLLIPGQTVQVQHAKSFADVMVPLTVSLLSWVPPISTTDSSANIRQVASGIGFATAGIYALEPQSLSLPISSTLELTYSVGAFSGLSEQYIRLYRWNSQMAGWEIVPAQLNTNSNSVMASISRLGTYALGVDQTPPAITLITPFTSAITSTVVPYIYAHLSDIGSGVDPSSVQVQINGQLQQALYKANTGELTVNKPTGLVNGRNRLYISAKDESGNAQVLNSDFGEGFIHVYLPNMIKGS